MDNIDFAILTKVQQLTERFGLKPYDLVATLDHSEHEPVFGMGVKFNIMTDHAKTDAEFDKIEKRGEQMLKLIGVADGDTLGGGEKEVIDALDAALQKAPKSPIKR